MFGKPVLGQAPTDSNIIFVATLTDNGESVNIYQLNSKKLNTLYGVTTDIATATVKIKGVAEEAILIGHKFYERYSKSYQQDLVYYKFYKILNARNPQVYEYDTEVQARIDAMKARKKLDFFGRRSFDKHVNTHVKKVNKSISSVSKYRAKEANRENNMANAFGSFMNAAGIPFQNAYASTAYTDNVNIPYPDGDIIDEVPQS